MRRTLLVTLVAVLGIGGFVAGARSEPPETGAPPVPEHGIEYVGPDTYILLDAEGRPQPVLGMSYEQFVAAWKESQRLAAGVAEPRFMIEEFRLDGKTREDHAELTVEITIRLLSESPVRIPLGMASAILRESPRWTPARPANGSEADPPAPYLDFDRRQGGFVAGVTGRRDERFVVSFPVLVPLVRDGNNTTLRLNCPRALVAKLTLDSPVPLVEAAVSEGSQLAREATRDGGTRLAVTGLAGDFQLSWSTAENQRPDLVAVLSATGAIWVEVDGHSIRSEARLTVGSYGGTFDRFRVQLPPGATLIQHRAGEAGGVPPYRATVETQPGGDRDDRAIVLVELAEKQTGPVEVTLMTEQPLGLPGADRAVELAGFEVVGAVRQFGDLAVRVADDWQARWEIGPNVRQVDPADLAPNLEAKQPTAAFQYDRQPWSLRTRVVARPRRIHVVPDYELELDADEARLHVHLAYQVPGARAFEFRVRLNGWELVPEPIESGGLIDRDDVEVTEDGLLVLPLAQASARRADVAFWLRRALTGDDVRFALPMPVPEADSVAAAELAVVVRAGGELSVDAENSRGLSPIPITDDAPIASTASGGAVLRYRCSLHDAVLVAERSPRPTQVTAVVRSELASDEQRLELTQSVDYLVENQPIDQLVVNTPGDWSLVDGKATLLAATTAGDAGATTTVELDAVASEAEGGVRDIRQVHIPLPQPRLGRFTMQYRFRAPSPTDASVADRIELPLPRPSVHELSSHRMRIAGALARRFALDPTDVNAPWQIASPPAGSRRTPDVLEIAASGDQAVVPLIVQTSAADRPPAVVVQRVWLQTWHSGDVVQDRAAFRIRSAGPLATIELPPVVSAAEVEVLCDGQLAHVTVREAGRLVVSLPETAGDSKSNATHTLELRYRRNAVHGLTSRETFTPPQLVGSSGLIEAYWHVVLPNDRHVIRAPIQLAPVDRWQWLGVFWGRHPAKSQADLEAWVGATHQSPPAAGHCEYLFSGLGPLASIEFVTAPRWFIVLAASGATLVVALSWLYLPVVRRPWVVLTAVVLIAAFALAYPVPALLLAQASLAGWVLATIAVFLRRRTEETTVRMLSTPGSTNLRLPTQSRTDSVSAPVLPTASNALSAPPSVSEPSR